MFNVGDIFCQKHTGNIHAIKRMYHSYAETIYVVQNITEKYNVFHCLEIDLKEYFIQYKGIMLYNGSLECLKERPRFDSTGVSLERQTNTQIYPTHAKIVN